MVAPAYLFIIVLLYILLLFALAYYAEKRELAGRSIVNNPYIYSLSLAVYCTSWTFYGSVGRASASGLFFLPIYLGPTVMVALWPVFLRKVIRIAKANGITTISDLLALRYGRSLTLSILVTVAAVAGVVPYIGLQLKAITTTFVIISGKTLWSDTAGLFIAFLLGAFTIMFGARRLNLSERHGGLVFAIAFESIVKLAAFLMVGAFVTFVLFDGFSDLFGHIRASGHSRLLSVGESVQTGYSEWFALFFLAMMAIVFLPRQFHMAVVENYNDRHLRKAAWLFPLYLLIINIFVLPVAFGGVLLEGNSGRPDSYVLDLPLHHGARYLAVIAFLGGFSAATGMVIVESLALSTMVMNSLVMPVLFRLQNIPQFPGLVLNIKRLVILGLILLGYIFAVTIGPGESLVEIGLKSFEAVALFAPSFILGLYWKKGNKKGAVAGLAAGFLIWFYTVMVPVLLKTGIIDSAGIIGLMAGSELFNPHALFGVSGLGKWGHTLFWSLLVNLVLYVGVSLSTRQSKEEELQSLVFVESYPGPAEDLHGGSYTVGDIEDILTHYLGTATARTAIEGFLSGRKKKRDELSARDLAELRDEAERTLSGATGPSMAAIIFENRFVLTEKERRDITDSIKTASESLRHSRRELAEVNKKLEYRAEIENLIATISIQFINLPPEDIAKGMVSALSTIGEFAGAEHGFAVLLSRDRASVDRIFEWHGEGIDPAIQTLRGFSVDSFKWWMEKLDKFGYLVIPRVSDLPAEALPEMEMLRSRSIRSLVAVLMVYSDSLVGFLGLDSGRKDKVWMEEDLAILQMLGVVFVNALERKRTEESVRELEEQFRQSQKMESIGTLTGGIAHDFNNILTAISGFGNLLKEKIQVDDTGRTYLEHVLSASERAAGLVQSLLAFSRKQATNPKPVDLNAIVRKTEKLLERLIGEDVELKTIIADCDLTVMADGGQIEQVLMNLATNARDAMPQGGLLTIETGTIIIGVKYLERHFLVKPGTYALISVSDTGTGMDEGTKARLFEPFFTTKESGKGTGLGLSMVYGTVKQHNGHINVYSEPGRGTTFRIYLPLIKAEKTIDEREAVPELKGGLETVLVAEDEEDVREFVKEALAGYGYQVIAASDGEEAVRLYMENRDKIQVVLFDVIMPKKNGREAYEEIKKATPKVKAVFMSGYPAATVSRQNILDKGMVFISKPMTCNELLTKVREALDGPGGSVDKETGERDVNGK